MNEVAGVIANAVLDIAKLDEQRSTRPIDARIALSCVGCFARALRSVVGG
jgi:hypothetical protein